VSTTLLEEEAVKLGIDLNAFQSCVGSSEIAAAIQSDLDTAISFGGSGTPFSVIVYEDGTTRPVSGALPYEQWTMLLGM